MFIKLNLSYKNDTILKCLYLNYTLKMIYLTFWLHCVFEAEIFEKINFDDFTYMVITNLNIWDRKYSQILLLEYVRPSFYLFEKYWYFYTYLYLS